MTDQPNGYAPNVVLALARVIADLPGIPKSMESGQGYKYRGIEQITVEAQQLFAKHGVVLVPHKVEWLPVTNFTINNRPWTDERLKVHYRCYGPGGPRDYIDVEAPGIGRDNSDKGSNKAMSQAFKYALLQALCIADARDDADAAHHEADQATEPPIGSGQGTRDDFVTKDEAQGFADRLADATKTPPEVVKAFQSWKDDQGFPWPWPRSAFGAMLDKLAELLIEHEVPEPEPPAPVGTDPLSGAVEPSESPAESPGSSSTPEASQERTRTQGGVSGAVPTEAEARAALEEAHRVLERRSKFEAHAKELKPAQVREQLAAAGLDATGAAPQIRDRLVDHLMRQGATADQAGVA